MPRNYGILADKINGQERVTTMNQIEQARADALAAHHDLARTVNAKTAELRKLRALLSRFIAADEQDAPHKTAECIEFATTYLDGKIT